MKYIIDGYNLIHKIEQCRQKRLRSQREELIRLLEEASGRDRRLRDLTVVFDGQSGVVAPAVISRVRVIFSRGKCADKKIRDIVQAASFARDIGVVSDDRQVRFYAGSQGAKRIAVDDFIKTVRAALETEAGFKLQAKEAQKINQELARVWLR